MKQTARIISTYAADVSGVCSALFELGGMTIMHDASGCNSTYNTHDEPRWYDTDSMVFLSAISETEAIMGDDQKLISDIVSTSNDLSPKFIAIAGTPVPMMIGTDFKAIAEVIEKKTGITTFGFATNGMHTYISGVSAALAGVAQRLVMPYDKTPHLSVNILGATPLDFSVNVTINSVKKILAENDIDVISCFAMGSSLKDISRASCASVNLVISYSGLEAARILANRFGTPYVIGLPTGQFTQKIISDINTAANEEINIISFLNRHNYSCRNVIIGESIIAESLAAASENNFTVICPVETHKDILPDQDIIAHDEDEIIPILKNAEKIVADPLYKPICPADAKFIPLPHEAFSGRIYRSLIPDLTAFRI